MYNGKILSFDTSLINRLFVHNLNFQKGYFLSAQTM